MKGKKINAFAFVLGMLAFVSIETTSAAGYTDAQCREIGGGFATDETACTASGEVKLGDYLNISCITSGICCGPLSSLGKIPSGSACVAQTCVSSGGSCRIACGAGSGPRAGSGCPSGQQCCSSPDEFCSKALGGNCVKASDTCGSKATQVGICETFSGVNRICCKPVVISGPAVSPYNLLEKIPGSSNTIGSLNTYLEDIYRFAFWAVGIAVVFMLTIGGFMYLTSAGNTSRLGTAKTIIFDAFLGLILALVAWMFLNLINPDLVNLTLPVSTIATPAPPEVTGGAVAGLASTLLVTPGVSVSGLGDCNLDAATAVSPRLSLQESAAGKPVTHCQKSCPSSGFCQGQTVLSETMLGVLIKTASIYQFDITSFTGGSHSGGSAHYTGQAVDIVPRGIPKSSWPLVQQYLRTTPGGATLVICDIWDATLKKNISISCEDPRADHIHAEW